MKRLSDCVWVFVLLGVAMVSVVCGADNSSAEDEQCGDSQMCTDGVIIPGKTLFSHLSSSQNKPRPGCNQMELDGKKQLQSKRQIPQTFKQLGFSRKTVTNFRSGMAEVTITVH